MKKILLLLSIIFLTQFAYAKNEITLYTKIIYIYTYKDFAILKIANKSTNPNNCTYPRSSEFFRINYKEGGKEMYSTVLAAFMSDTKIRLGHGNCAKGWGKTMPLVYRVDISK